VVLAREFPEVGIDLRAPTVARDSRQSPRVESRPRANVRAGGVERAPAGSGRRRRVRVGADSAAVRRASSRAVSPAGVSE
jgi:hypothetical protein